MSFITGPIAPESNPTIEPENYQPSRFTITAISYSTSTTVTTSASFGVNNNYVVGQLIRFVIPMPFGAQQLNGQQGFVVGLPGTNQVTVNINTSKGYDAFISSPPDATTPAQIIAIGDVNTGPQNSSRSSQTTYISGSFRNISPS